MSADKNALAAANGQGVENTEAGSFDTDSSTATRRLHAAQGRDQ